MNGTAVPQCPATRSARSTASPRSANRTARRSAASSTAVRRAWRSRKPTSSASSTGASRARRGTSRSGANRTPSRSCRACSRGRRPERRSRCSSATRISAARTMRRSPTRSGPGTPTTRTGRSTAFATIAAAAARRRARPRCASLPARSRRNGCASATASSIRGHLAQLGPKAIPFENWAHVDANPFFVAERDDRARARGVHGRAAQVRRLLRREDHRGRDRRAGRLGRARVRHARRRPRAGDDGHQRGEGRRDRRGLRERRAARDRAFRRNDAAGLPVEQRGRHPRRHFDRPGRSS